MHFNSFAQWRIKTAWIKTLFHRSGKMSLCEMCPNTEFFLVCIFPGKYGPEKTPYLDTSHAVYVAPKLYKPIQAQCCIAIPPENIRKSKGFQGVWQCNTGLKWVKSTDKENIFIYVVEWFLLIYFKSCITLLKIKQWNLSKWKCFGWY